jgi:hypothetical protein
MSGMSKHITIYFPNGKEQEFKNVTGVTVLPGGALVFKPKPTPQFSGKVTTNLPFLIADTKTAN